MDPIKVAEGRYLADELTIHYGLLPRTHRGIFVLNELPDLAERIQVGLLNIMEERDVQIRGYLVRLPLDLLVVASANPEDYTNRGRIITPLKDRFGSQVRTHYPRTLAHEIGIVEQEATRFAPDGYQVEVPAYMQEIVAELTHLARRSAEISQRSGVSVRVSICNYENLVSNALRRAVRLREPLAVPRVSDLGATLASTAGKIELETAGDGDEGKVVERLAQKAVLAVFNRHFQAAMFGELLEAFGRGLTWEVGEAMPAADYERQAGRAAGFGDRDVAPRRRRPSRPRRRRGGVRARGPAPEPEAQQGPGRRRAPVQGVRSRYSRWDGSQSLPEFDADDLLAAMADDLVADGDVRRALERLLRQGFRTRDGEQVPGLRDLLARLRRERQASPRPSRPRRRPRRPPQAAARTSSTRSGRGSTGASTPRARRRKAASRRPRRTVRSSSASRPSVARRWTRCRRISAAPSAGSRTTSSSIPEAWQKFQELMLRLRQEMTQSLFGQLKQGLQGLGSQGTEGLRDMLGDLNRMLRQQAAGGRPDVQGFMDRWGQMFPGVQSLDQLLDRLARQSAQLQSLLESLTPEQRRELEALQEAMLDDPGMQEALAELGEHLDRLGLGQRTRRYRTQGDTPLSLQEALRLMGELHGLDRLEEDLQDAERTGRVDRVDPEAVRDALGEQAAQEAEALRRLAEALEAAGYLEQRGRQWVLTPQAIRKIAQRALAEVLGQLRRDRPGRHPVDARGAGGDPTDESKPYEFGDPFLLDLRETLGSALRRQGPGLPLRLEPADFAVRRTELSTRCATALLLDMSRSMIYRGCWTAAKKVALALHALIRAQYPQDALYVIGFSLYARELDPDDVPSVVLTDRHYGTNMQHALQLARRLLGRHRGGNRQVVMITDGEPTAHLEGSEAYFDYPTTRRTWQLTQAEVLRCAREGVTINTFMLEDSPGLVRFVSEMSRINRGRAFFVQPDRLGEYVLVDYLARKQKRVG